MGGGARPDAQRRSDPDVSTVTPAGATEAESLRALESRDIASIVAIERASFSDPWSEASFRSTIANPQVLAHVVEREGAVVGYSIAWMVSDEAELANLAIAGGVRQAGLGGRLLDHLLGAIAARGGAAVYLEVRDSNVAARALYASRGFVVTGRRAAYYRSPDEDAVLMRRPQA